jgi:hypothetical protein
MPPQMAIACLPNLCSPTHTAPRRPNIGCQPGVTGCRFGGRAECEVQGGDQDPAGGQHSDARNRLQAFGRCHPALVLTQRGSKLAFNLSDLVVQGVEQAVHPSLDVDNDARLAQERMALVVHLGSDLDQGFVLNQPLLQFGIYIG